MVNKKTKNTIIVNRGTKPETQSRRTTELDWTYADARVVVCHIEIQSNSNDREARTNHESQIVNGDFGVGRANISTSDSACHAHKFTSLDNGQANSKADAPQPYERDETRQSSAVIRRIRTRRTRRTRQQEWPKRVSQIHLCEQTGWLRSSAVRDR